MEKQVINGKVVKRWFSKGKARIPVFEDGTIGLPDGSLRELKKEGFGRNEYNKLKLEEKFEKNHSEMRKLAKKMSEERDINKKEELGKQFGELSTEHTHLYIEQDLRKEKPDAFGYTDLKDVSDLEGKHIKDKIDPNAPTEATKDWHLRKAVGGDEEAYQRAKKVMEDYKAKKGKIDSNASIEATNRYDTMENYEIYEEAEKYYNEISDFDTKREIAKRLDRIDKANKKGEGYATKPINELKEILKNKNSIKTITQEEYDKMPKDYKGTLKELVDTAKFRGEDSNTLRKEYEAKGYDVDKDKTILEYSNGGTILRPVKIKEEKTISKEKGEAFLSAFKTALKEEQNGYTQKVDWNGGTHQYSKAQLDRMKEAGIKPMEHSYTGGGWQGTNYDSSLSTKDIAKKLNDFSKQKYPDVKISRKTDYNSIDMNIMSSEKDLFVSNSDIDKMEYSDFDRLGTTLGFESWAEKNTATYKENKTYNINDLRRYAKEEMNNVRNTNHRVTGDEWYLSKYGKEVVSDLNKQMNSYDYDDSDGMVDYFDSNFYGTINIGKWDKPYEVVSKEVTTKAKIERFKNRKK